MELGHYFGGWVGGPSKQANRTDGGWVQSTFSAKAEQIKLAARSQTPVKTSGKRIAQICSDFYVVWTLFPGFEGQGGKF